MAEAITPDPLHVDYVVNDGAAETQSRRCSLRVDDGDLVVDWIGEVTSEEGADLFLDWCFDRLKPPNWPNRKLQEVDLGRLSSATSNGYVFFTEPHGPHGCPFAGSNELPMTRLTPEEAGMRLLTPAEVDALTDAERAELEG